MLSLCERRRQGTLPVSQLPLLQVMHQLAPINVDTRVPGRIKSRMRCIPLCLYSLINFPRAHAKPNHDAVDDELPILSTLRHGLEDTDVFSHVLNSPVPDAIFVLTIRLNASGV